MEKLSPICPATDQYCSLRAVAIGDRENWQAATTSRQEMLTRQERFTDSILGLPLRAVARLLDADLNSGLRKQVQVARDKARAYEDALRQPCAAATLDDCPLPQELSEHETS